MATTTTNFGWDIPQSTDLVKDGATAIAALGQDIDTALLDLKGGSINQILAKNSATDLDYKWIDDQSQVLLSTTTLSGSATNITSISQSYKDLLVYVYGVENSASAHFRIKFTGTDSLYCSGQNVAHSYDGTAANNGEDFTSANGLRLTLPITKGTGADNSWVIRISDYTKSLFTPMFKYEGQYASSGGLNTVISGAANANQGTSLAITNLNFVLSTGTFSAGTVKIYGVK